MSDAARAIRVAIMGPYPASGVVPAEQTVSRHVAREHPCPWVRLLAQEFGRRDGVTVRVFVDTRAVRRTMCLEAGGVEFVFTRRREPTRLDPFSLFIPTRLRMARHLKRFRPDVVSAFGTEAPYGLVGALSGYPCVLTIQGIWAKLAAHSTIRGCRAATWQWLERRALRNADGLIGKTDYSARWARTAAPGSRCRVIPNPVLPRFFEARPTFKGKNVLAIGALSRIKGTDCVLRAFREVGDREAGLLMIGREGATQCYRQLAAELGIADRVSFVGRVGWERIMDEMRDARAVVLASRMDTSPNVVTEAQAAGLPVVATAVGGIPDMIADAEDGFLVAPGDHHHMAARISQLLADASLARELGQRGRARVRRDNGLERVADDHLQFYRETVAAVRRGRAGDAPIASLPA